MADDVFRLFEDYAARFARGERPDTREYLARAGEDADQLASLIDRYLESVPAPGPSEEAQALTEAWLEGEPPRLALRTKRGLRRDAVVNALMTSLGLDPAKREKVRGYYHRLETVYLTQRGLIDAYSTCWRRRCASRSKMFAVGARCHPRQRSRTGATTLFPPLQ